MKSRKFGATIVAIMLGVSLSVTGCGKLNPNADVIKIDDKDSIKLGYANFAAKYQQSDYDMYLLSYYGEQMWSSDMSGSGKTMQDETKEAVIDDIEEMYLCTKHAADYDVKLSQKEQEAIEKAAKKFIKANDKTTLDIMTADEKTVEKYLEDKTITNKVQAAVKEAAKIEISDDECWERTFSYVKFDTQNSAAADDAQAAPEPLTKKEIAKLTKKAKTISKADDFEAACQAADLEVQTYSYNKTETVDSIFDMSVIKAASKLKEGQISKPIKVDADGIYVLRLDSDHDMEASEQERDSLKSAAENEAYTNTISEWKEKVKFEVDEKLWDKVEFDVLFKAPETEAENK